MEVVLVASPHDEGNMKKKVIKRSPGYYGDLRIDSSIPVLILGGKENSLSLTRSLGQVGIKVIVSGPESLGMYSRFCSERYPVSGTYTSAEFWGKLLLGKSPIIKKQHVLLACDDDALEFLAENESKLRERFIFDPGKAQQRLALLNKKLTLELAMKVGIAAPKFWPVSQTGKSDDNFEDCQFPILIKPYNTFKFAKVFGQKFFTVESGINELMQKIRITHDKGFDVSVMEKIPGPDDLLSSYYTYIDKNGNALFHFTKKIFRRYPVNMGMATYHATEWLPETAEQGLSFFKKTGFRGLGNIEFKKDPRDGKLKIMEVNARFTAAQELAVKANVPIDLIVYCDLTEQAIPTTTSYLSDLRYWYPVRDFQSFLQLRRMGQMGFSEWLTSIHFKQNVDPVFDYADLEPSIRAIAALVRKLVRR